MRYTAERCNEKNDKYAKRLSENAFFNSGCFEKMPILEQPRMVLPFGKHVAT